MKGDGIVDAATGQQEHDPWPVSDPENRPVRFVQRIELPHPDEIRPVLEGELVRLRPLELLDIEMFCIHGLEPDIWRYMPESVESPERMKLWIQEALEDRANGKALPFVVETREPQPRFAGSSRFLNIDRKNMRLEIGSTWYTKEWRGTSVNSEAKLLMLSFAFEKLGCIRVEFKTDSLNLRSRAAIASIGAVEEGTFRNHMITSSGRVRHTVYFSIGDTEWSSVKAGLKERIALRSRRTDKT